MKTFLLTLLLTGVHFHVSSQISIQPVVPLAGIIQKNNLWNIAVINTSSATFECRIELTLRDRASGLEVLTATSGFFQLETGAKQLNASNLIPVQYNYISPSGSSRNDDFIPIGDYTACYRLTANSKNLLAEECISFDVEPLSPPMLISPIDSSILESAPSQFTWIAPSPVNLFNRLQYEVLISEILPGQKAEEAMQQNIPFHTEPNLITNTLTSKGEASSFEKDKWYAWQVTARDDNKYAGKSEVWVFKISVPKTVKASPTGVYLLMNSGGNTSYAIAGNVLHIKYVSDLPEFDAIIRFTDIKNKPISSIQKRIVQGENYFDLPLSTKFKSQNLYHVLVTDNYQHTQKLTFSITTK